MNAVAFKPAIKIHWAHYHGDGVRGKREIFSTKGCQKFRLRSGPYGFRNDELLLTAECRRFMKPEIGLSGSKVSCSSVPNLNSASLQTYSDASPDNDNESVLLLIRHGESMWNEKNLFTGCVDVPLTEKGVEEAIEAGKRIRNMPIDIVFTSALIRSQMTAMLALTEHCRMKVPIFTHNENEPAKEWSQIHSEATKKQSIPIVKAWQLNERMYGELQGYNKQETAEKYGKDQVHKWRRTYDVQPPNGESLEMCLRRAVAFFQEQIEPQLLTGKHVMVVAHANSLRSMIMYLDKLTSQEVIDLELSTGVPMLYIYRDGQFIRRGSPLGSAEAGVYAYTESLALHRHELEEELF